MVLTSPDKIATVSILQTILNRIQTDRENFSRLGVIHAYVFGSVAREEDNAASDVDVLVETEPRVSLFDMVDIHDQFARTVGREVDVVSRGGLRLPRHRAILDDAVRAF